MAVRKPTLPLQRLGVGPWCRLGSLVVSSAVAGLIGACTFGLGDYPSQASLVLGPGATSVDGGADTGVELPEEPPVEPADDASTEVSSDGGACNSKSNTDCTGPGGGDSGTCTGKRSCVGGVWSACKLPLKCPATWSGPNTTTTCQHLNAHGTSDKWTDSPMVPQKVLLWSVTRASPFELYGVEDAFCFVPKDLGGCYTGTTTVISVECTGANLKVSADDFAKGRAFDTEFCIKNAGPTCEVYDVHGGGGPWQPQNAVRCERWFEQTQWRARAEPRCSW